MNGYTNCQVPKELTDGQLVKEKGQAKGSQDTKIPRITQANSVANQKLTEHNIHHNEASISHSFLFINHFPRLQATYSSQ